MPYRKKIFDITPSRREFKELPAEKPAKLELAAFNRKPASGMEKLIPLFLALVLLAGGLSSYFLIPPKVTVDIWPKKNDTNEIIAATVKALPKDGNSIVGEIAKEEKIVSQSFPATGTKLKLVKAWGTIRVYNAYSTASQSLVATTRFVSDDGKLFRTPVKVVIPGGHYEGGKLVPGFVDIEVVADQPGEDYNIDASTFSIPGFAGTPKYTAFYAKSFEPMEGGLKKEVPQVSQSDLDKARGIITEKARSESIAALKNSVSSEYIMFDQAITVSPADFTGVQAGEESESFTAQAKATAKALVFKKSDLKNFAENYIKGKIPAGEKLIDNFFKVDYVLESADLQKQELSLKLSISARSYFALEDTQIKEMVKERSAEDVENILKSLSWLEKAKVDFWPFWVDLAPKNLESIEPVWHLD